MQSKNCAGDKTIMKFNWLSILTNSAIISFLFLSLFLLFHNIRVYSTVLSSTGDVLFYYGIPISLSLILLYFLKSHQSIKTNATLFIIVLFLLLYPTELVLVFCFPQYISNRDGVEVDNKTKIEFIVRMRAEGKKLYPVFPPSHFFNNPKPKLEDGNEIFPLSSVPNALTVTGNENGKYVVYKSDECGFNNPNGIWNSHVDIAVVGDSFANGMCVLPEKNAVGVVRSRFNNTLNLGMPGNGPLLMLAGIREYLSLLRPSIVVWMFFEGNDLAEINREMNDAIIKRYIEPGFSQNLFAKQSIIDNYLTNKIDTDESLLNAVKNARPLVSILKLRDFRARVHMLLGRIKHKSQFEKDKSFEKDKKQDEMTKRNLIVFREILEMAVDDVKSWGGNLIFVYLPQYERFDDIQSNHTENRSDILEIVGNLNIECLDMSEKFDLHKDPLSFFPFRKIGHYNERGYSEVGNAILEKLKAYYQKPTK